LKEKITYKFFIKIFFICIFLQIIFFNNYATSKELNFIGSFTQGGLIRGQVSPGSKVFLDKKLIKVSKNGFFVFGFGRNHPNKSFLEIVYNNEIISKKTLKISQRKWKSQKINGLPKKMVSPNKEAIKVIRDNNREISAARKINSDEIWFLDDFYMPVSGHITGVYGTKRILNGKDRQPHYGIDIAAPKGTPVIAPARGKVTLAKKDHYYTGGTIILDHGHGLSSAFLHLDKLAVSKGKIVKRGEVIGFVGSTGRSTGYHLDWRINWFKTRIDPQLVVKEN